MLFPKRDRVIYEGCPLINVVCQLRFPPVLKIDSDLPSDFQGAIQNDFPIYSQNIEYQNEITIGNLPDALNLNNPFSKIESNKNHQFASEDGKWTINLTRTFIAISTSDYFCWEDFMKKFAGPFMALMKIYKPAFFTRVGLRYIDVFCRSRYHVNRYSWNSLIQPYLLGLLSTNIKTNISGYSSVFEIGIPENIGTVRLAASLVNDAKSEQCFMLDTDIFNMTRTDNSDVLNCLGRFHDEASGIIRWAIKDKLHFALGPKEMSDECKYEK